MRPTAVNGLAGRLLVWRGKRSAVIETAAGYVSAGPVTDEAIVHTKAGHRTLMAEAGSSHSLLFWNRGASTLHCPASVDRLTVQE
jgi:hypothetical protein